MANFLFKDSTAKIILGEFKKVLKLKPKTWNGRGRIEMYSNDLEQGYCIKSWNEHGTYFNVAFAKSAVADEIVVYSGNGVFSNPGNVPDKNAQDHARKFPPADYKGAAKHILERIEGFLGIK